MAKTKEINTRIIHKHDIEANWEKATAFIPKISEIIIYDIDENYDYERIKIGDGVTVVTELPFADDALRSELASAIEGSVANWEQNDSTSIDYIKNRTHYLTEYSSYSSNVIETPVGGMQLLMDLSSASSNFLKAISYENITSDYTKATYWFSLSGETYLSSLKRWATLYSLINNKPQRINSMDEKNYSYTVGTAFIVYVIQDISFLTESDKERFAANGIYLWLKDEGTAAIYRNLRWLCEKIVRLEKYYLPADTVYSGDLATVATTGDYNDLLNAPEIATDEEIIEMIAQEDMLPVVADSDGSLLSDENENILLW